MGAIFEVMISFLFVKPIPRFNFDKTKLKKILSRGKWITTSGIFNYLYHNADDVVVGRILGTSSLGLYDMTYKISTLPITEVADVVSRVIFPIYTKFSDDSIRLKRAFIKTMGGVSLVTIFIGLILFFFPEKVIEIVLGPLWLDAVPVLKILGFFGVIRAISGTTSALFLAVKKQELVTVVTFVSLLGLAVSILPLVAYYGLVGAALASLVGTISAVPIMIYFTIKVFSGNEKSNSKSLY
jgi:O-antigen/teichoic acid export membrane protein